MWAICPCVNLALFLPFFQVFPLFCFRACRASFSGLFGGVHFVILRRVSVCLHVSGGSFGACDLYLLYGAKIGAGCLVIQAGFVCPCQSVGLSGAGRVCMAPSFQASPWLQPSNKFSNKCPKTPFEQIFETSVRVALWLWLAEFPTESDRILTES
jgi:hypothetical protein